MTKKSDHCRFLDLYSKVQPRLYSFILMLVQNHQDADEIFQETSGLLWEKFDQYQEGTNFGAWAVSVAKYKVFEFLRKSKHDKEHLNSDLLLDIAEIAEPKSQQVDNRLQSLQKCLYKMDRISRSLLNLRYQQNISVKDMARRKGVSTGVMYRRLTKIFTSLRKCIQLSMVK